MGNNKYAAQSMSMRATDIVPPFEVQKYCLDSWFVKLCNKNEIYDLKEYSFQYEINNKSVTEF